jgi:hypothetical protein
MVVTIVTIISLTLVITRISLIKLSYSEWVIVAQHQQSNILGIWWREQVNFQWDDDKVYFALFQHAQLDFYSASSLKQQSADRHVVQLGYIIHANNHTIDAVATLYLNFVKQQSN